MRGGHGLVTSLLDQHDFLVDPLPNLLFTRDSSVWVRDRVAVTSLAMPARRRETQLTELIYTEHPRFRRAPARSTAGTSEHVEGGDVLLLAPGVIAVGVGERTTPAGVERFARQVFHAGSPTPCSPCRSRRSARRCTSTPSARWSTSTRS